uniref:DUF1995 domain-containing protein n=1 Tax=Chaetoceros debilis TaxID=122233 RepID=A0A7S3VH04_9STRA|mmetsp:Transcript_28101/g.43053  ORF Transcript_28101/g.43053 Transcript_28101/m.43053 type:complete len:362 (+) Transcript_28101:103-1188(+)|eukprot:CAMPEP_0194119802 /NCGR_PEP_ID=MMETSP0150-20130528/40862_1 /TAXON_ID=122233 /ORGANISM="Chaetoceros debilis, Strain MM31A-1" /LENGTH=361 /DNA_ID=CAMNT_0038811633 /DNA_START=69 /DNA_END=1154 /DNA_ORIENTATION=+
MKRILLSLLVISDAQSFQISRLASAPRASTQLQISNIFQQSTGSSQPSLPKDVKEAVSQCRAAVQKGLENRLSRMDVEFPVGTKFGVEKNSGQAKKRGGKLASAMGDDDNNSGITKNLLDTSDRELGRLFVEMFQPVGGDNIACVFSDGNLADAARIKWKGDLGAECRITSISRGSKMKKASMKGMKGMGAGSKGKKKKNKQFAAKMNEEFSDENSGPFKLPDNCEVALFVAPTAKDLITVNRICDEVGMGTLVVLLNARLGLIDNFGTEESKEFFASEFEDMYYLSIAPQDAAPGCLMNRAYPNDWILARKPKVGPPKTIETFSKNPSSEECAAAFETVEIGDMEKNVENVLENVATWLS